MSDSPSEWPSGRARRIAGVSLVVGGALLLIPRPTGWVWQHVHKEDGEIFLSEELFGAGLFDRYTGYVHLLPRLITKGCVSLPPTSFSGCVSVATAGVRVAIAALALAVLMPYCRRWGWALAAASTVLVAGVGQQEVLGNLTNLRWFGDIAAVLIIASRFTRASNALPAAALAVLAALSDPLVILLAPVAALRLVWLRGWARAPSAALALGSAAHFAVLETGARSTDLHQFLAAPGEAFLQLAARGPLAAVFGENGTQVGLDLLGAGAMLGLALPALVLFTAPRRETPWWMVAWLVSAGMGILTVTLAYADFDAIPVLGPAGVGQASRYALAPGLLVAMALLIASSWVAGRLGRWARTALVATMVCAVLADFRGDPYNSSGPHWADTVAEAPCTPGTAEVVVPVTPTNVPHPWEARIPCSWLGEQALTGGSRDP